MNFGEIKSKILKILIYKYFLLVTFLKTSWSKIKSFFIKVNSIYTIDISNNKQVNIYYWYLLYKLIEKIKNMTKYLLFSNIKVVVNKYLEKILTIMNFKSPLITLEVTDGKIKRNLIYENKYFNEVMNDILSIEFDINELLLNKKCLVKDINLIKTELINNEEIVNKYSIKKIIEKYSDRSKKYTCHTLKNILLINNIYYDNNSELEIEYFKIPVGKVVKKELLKYKVNSHITEIYDL